MIGECRDLERFEANSRETKEDGNTDKAGLFMFSLGVAPTHWPHDGEVSLWVILRPLSLASAGLSLALRKRQKRARTAVAHVVTGLFSRSYATLAG